MWIVEFCLKDIKKQLMQCCIAISCQTECLIERVFVLLLQSYDV